MAYEFRHAFGPGQITAVAIVPGEYFVVDELRNFSISSHFDKVGIRRLGHRLPVGWATGSGTIAGTLIFAQLTRGAFWRLRRYAGTVRVAQGRTMQSPKKNRAEVTALQSGIRPEQLPPFELMFVHASESGQMAISRLYDVTISDTGSVKGQGNQFTEEQLQYKAKFHEQIQLHRSLSTSQMVELANEHGLEKQKGFFNDPRQSNALLDNLLNVSGIDDGNIGEYLIAETEKVEETDIPTAMDIADAGEVLFQEQPDDHSESTTESETIQEAEQKTTDITHKIQDTVIVEEDDGSLSKLALTAHLELKGQSLYLSGSKIKDVSNHEPVADGNAGEPVVVNWEDYYGPLLDGNYGLGDLRFYATLITLRVNDRSVMRAAGPPAKSFTELEGLSAEHTEQIPAGTYVNEGLFLKEVYEVTSGDPQQMEVTAVPPSNLEAGDTATLSGGTFDFEDGPSFQYDPQTNTLNRTEALDIAVGSGTLIKDSYDNWHWVESIVSGSHPVVNITAEVTTVQAVFDLLWTDRDGNEYSDGRLRPPEGEPETHEPITYNLEKGAAVATVVTDLNADDQHVMANLSVSFSSPAGRCLQQSGDTARPVLIKGDWRGRDVDLSIAIDSSFSGTVAGQSVSGTTRAELLSQSGVYVKATRNEAEIQLRTKDVSV